MEYTKSLVEVYEVIKYLEPKELEKIPDDVLDMINENKDKNYQWKYDEAKGLKEQNLSREAIVILSYLNMEYLLNEQQKRYMNELHRYNETKREKQKKEEYDYNDIFKDIKKESVTSKQALIKYEKEKWYNKILNKIRNIFKSEK